MPKFNIELPNSELKILKHHSIYSHPHLLILITFPTSLVSIETSKESVIFSVNGEIGAGSVKIKANDSEKPEDRTILEVDEPVNLSFALRYLNLFNKASNLSNSVTLSLSNDTPLVVEYKIEKLGSLKFYLAPKITDDETA